MTQKRDVQLEISNKQLANSKKIEKATDEEIKQVLRYIVALVGVPSESIPSTEAKWAMLEYIKKHWKNNEISEMKDAFESAMLNNYCDKDGNSLLKLYGYVFNVNYIRTVVLAHREWLNNHKPKTEIGPNLYQTTASVFDIFKKHPEFYKKLRTKGEEKIQPKAETKPYTPRERTQQERLFDAWMNRFDEKTKEKKRVVDIGFGPFKLDDYLLYRLNNFNARFGITEQTKNQK